MQSTNPIQVLVPMTITNKRDMYELLREGKLGNTLPMAMSPHEWANSPIKAQYYLWGIRSMLPGGPGALNVPRAEALNWCYQKGLHLFDEVNISPMVDQWATLRAECFEGPDGFTLEYIPPNRDVNHLPHPWRDGFRLHRRRLTNTLAREYLKQFMNENSYEDLKLLLDLYPGHVIEFSCLNRCVGSAPNRNAIIWEVRNY